MEESCLLIARCLFVFCSFMSNSIDTVFAPAFADAIQCAHKDCKYKHVVNRAIILFIQNPHYLHYFVSIIEPSILMALLCYYKYKLGKVLVTIQRTQPFLAFLCYRENPVKCSACAVAQKIETACF